METSRLFSAFVIAVAALLSLCTSVADVLRSSNGVSSVIDVSVKPLVDAAAIAALEAVECLAEVCELMDPTPDVDALISLLEEVSGWSPQIGQLRHIGAKAERLSTILRSAESVLAYCAPELARFVLET